MCSIVGYIGCADSRDFILEGLSRLEYRGYDSAGMAWLNNTLGSISHCKTVGSVRDLSDHSTQTYSSSQLGIGHTRWATHGKATTLNAHPHFDCSNSIAIVHNGTIENFDALKHRLVKDGHILASDTDTEIVAHLLESELPKHASLHEAVAAVASQLIGAFTCVILSKQHPDTLIAVRNRSPLCIGVGHDAYYIASDPFAFIGNTDQAVFLSDATFALITKSSLSLYDFAGNPRSYTVEPIHMEREDLDKKGHDTFMVKEIFEQRSAIHNTIAHVTTYAATLSSINFECVKKIRIIACGTSWHAALIAKHFFEHYAHIETTVHLASEFRHYSATILAQQAAESLYIFVSQSGETADTLEALRGVKIITPDALTVAITNVTTSTIAREALHTLCTKAGREIAVASTKAFTSQISLLYWFAHFIAQSTHRITTDQYEEAQNALFHAAQILENSIYQYKKSIDTFHAPWLSSKKQIIFLGRDVSYPLALEAALKCNEITYIFSLAYPTGELKHGPLALLDEHTPILLISHQDPAIYQKILVNAQEIKARSEELIVCAFEGQDELIALASVAFVVPKATCTLLGPLALTGILQYLLCAMGIALERPIDKPRNLAKSVTVE